jgi:hypothetical protein
LDVDKEQAPIDEGRVTREARPNIVAVDKTMKNRDLRGISAGKVRKPLQEKSWKSINRGGITSSTPVDSKQGNPGARWPSTKAKVQTTLSLSVGNEPGFRICKDCNMLYNPLNEKDRKDHAREHAASSRRKRRPEKESKLDII